MYATVMETASLRTVIRSCLLPPKFDEIYRKVTRFSADKTGFEPGNTDVSEELVLKYCKMDVTCDLCGSTNFYKEAGYYYCSECQRQTQEIQEQVLDQEAAYTQAKTAKKVPTAKKGLHKTTERLTSWECYNYILLGIVNELIELGAHDSLRNTVQALWLKYLKVMEVIRHADQPPKLSAVNSSVDAEIIYGRKISKKPRSRSASPSSASDTTPTDAQSLKRERTKRKRALARAEYDDYNITQQSNVSLLNQSLTSLKSSSEATSKNVENYLQFNRFAQKQLKQVMKKSHLVRHRKDVHSTLTCHKLNYRMFKSSYAHSPEVLSRQKLFAIIYLGLLINKDKIQLGDLLRFIREGHLSYEHVQHFFPEDYEKKNLNIDSFNAGNKVFAHKSFRLIATKMAKLLHVAKYIPTQDIVNLCKRYCKELNLPDDLYNYVMTLFKKTLPKMTFSNNSKIIPNYEGRVISFIFFTLKIFFGLDEKTEFLLSDLAMTINKNLIGKQSQFNTKTFNFKNWLKYIEYRKLIITEVHFPSAYAFDNADNSHLFINFINDYNDKCGVDNEATIQMEVVKNLLKTVTNSSNPFSENVNFSASLTPYYDYVLGLLNSNFLRGNYLTNILNNNFKHNTLDFLIRTKLYLKALNPNIEIIYKHGGANDVIEFTNVVNKDLLRMKNARIEKHKHNVTIVDERIQNDNSAILKCNGTEYYSEIRIKSFENEHLKTFKTNELITEKLEETKQQFTDAFINDPEAKIYVPAERFWLHTNNASQKTAEEFAEFLNKLPFTFRLILRECARITEQAEQDLFEEYNIVELYLCYADNLRKQKVCDIELEKLINISIKLW